MYRIILSVILLISELAAFPLLARTITVGTSDNAPFVYKNQSGQLEGFSIDLIKEIALERGYKINFLHTDLTSKLHNVTSGIADFAIGGISVTYDRSQSGMIFSYPTMNAGLAILVKKNLTELSVIPIVIRNLINVEVAKMLGFLFIVLLFWGFWLWLAERGSDVIRDNFKDGFQDAIWCAWAIKTTIGFGDVYPKKILGRTLTIPIFFTGAVVIAVVAAPINAAFVQRNIGAVSSSIRGIEDLRGKHVATKSGTIAVKTIESIGARVTETESIEDAYKLLKEEKVDAIVFDSPVLIRYAKMNPEYTITGPLFAKHHFAIAFPQKNTLLRDQINITLLKLRKDGRYKNIYDRYF